MIILTDNNDNLDCGLHRGRIAANAPCIFDVSLLYIPGMHDVCVFLCSD